MVLITCRMHFEKRLDRNLRNVNDVIGKLNAHLKLLLVEPTRTADRQSKVLDVHQDVTQLYHKFSQFFDGLKTGEKKNIRHLALERLWDQFRQWRNQLPDLEGPGDGQLYEPEDINRANALLKALHQAWTNMEDCSSYPPPKKLTKMGMICLILTGMGQQQLLEDFLDSEKCDDDLHLSKEQLQLILREQHLNYAKIFLSEQYRAKPRRWEDDDHVEMEDEEPLPLIQDKIYGNGSYGIVLRVLDPASNTFYALKKQIIGQRESINVRARDHIKDEMDRLKRLQHKHVIKLVKSYERADSIGLLLTPAATCDLDALLNRFRKNNFNTRKDCEDQKWLRPVFLKAFGCLSQGLAYIHGQNIRHKDIKPRNILYDMARGENDEDRFLWADFGLAYDYSATGNSKTDSDKIYSKRYAAPEILTASIGHVRTERRASTMGLDRIVENGEISSNFKLNAPEEKILSSFKEEGDTSHGRKTDIFSLGCVFLEILAVLVKDELPMNRQQRNFAAKSKIGNHQLPDGGKIAAAPIASDDDMFCKHTSNLKEWAHLQSASSKDPENATLAPLFHLASKTISWRADDRPLIDDAIREIATAGETHFYRACWAEVPSEQRATKAPEVPPAVKEKAPKHGPGRIHPRSSGSPRSGSGSGKPLSRRSTAILRFDTPASSCQIIGLNIPDI